MGERSRPRPAFCVCSSSDGESSGECSGHLKKKLTEEEDLHGKDDTN